MDTDPQEPSEDAVARYLEQHPAFLESHPALIARLAPPGGHGDNAATGIADFQQFMVRRLQSDLTIERRVKGEVLAHARGSMNLLTRVHSCVLALLEAQSIDDLAGIVTGDLPVYLDFDSVMLILEGRRHDAIPSVPLGSVDRWLAGKPLHTGRDIEGDAAIHGEGAGLVRAELLLRLEIAPDAPPGLLAFGSRDPDGFDDGQSMELLGFLARVIERCLHGWMEKQL